MDACGAGSSAGEGEGAGRGGGGEEAGGRRRRGGRKGGRGRGSAPGAEQGLHPRLAWHVCRPPRTASRARGTARRVTRHNPSHRRRFGPESRIWGDETASQCMHGGAAGAALPGLWSPPQSGPDNHIRVMQSYTYKPTIRIIPRGRATAGNSTADRPPQLLDVRAALAEPLRAACASPPPP